MSSVVDICNRALSKIGAARVTAITDSKPCNSAYEAVRDRVFRAYPWNCLMERAQLAPLSTDPVYEYDYQYQIPSDCNRVIEVDTPYQWVVEGRKILTDEGDVLNIRYQKKETDPAKYDSILIEALAARLAFEICEEITQSNTKKELAFNDYVDILREAKRADAQEQGPNKLKESDWVTARY